MFNYYYYIYKYVTSHICFISLLKITYFQLCIILYIIQLKIYWPSRNIFVKTKMPHILISFRFVSIIFETFNLFKVIKFLDHEILLIYYITILYIYNYLCKKKYYIYSINNNKFLIIHYIFRNFLIKIYILYTINIYNEK